MIVTVTPNSALDITIRARVERGQSHRVPPALRRAGGKGVNVARVLHGQHVPTLAVAPYGGASGQEFAADLRAAGIPHALVPVDAATRSSYAIVDDASGETTIFNEEGQPLLDTDWRGLRDQVRSALADASAAGDPAAGATVLVGSGSLPAAAPERFFGDLVELAQEARVRCIVDTSGAPLLAAARAGADLLKPNAGEAMAATGCDSAPDAVAALLAAGARAVLLSLGKDGLQWWEPGRQPLAARLPTSLSGNPTGAGDAVVAAVAAAWAQGNPAEDALRLAAAWSGAAVLMPQAGDISARWPDLADQVVFSPARKDVPCR